MSQVYLGQICMFGGNFPPRNFAMCNGQLLSIAQNTALFSLLGTTYGGDGRVTFGLPNLQSQLPVHQGQGPNLSSYVLGQAGGSPSVTIAMNTMTAHSHTLEATQDKATTATIGGTVLPGQPTAGTPPAFYGVQVSGEPPLVPQILTAATVGFAGGNQPHTNLMPSLCITFIIALQGVFPSRN